MADHSASVLDRLGVESLPDKESWLGVRATRIVGAVNAQVVEATSDHLSFIYGLAINMLGNHLLHMVETGTATDDDDAKEVMESNDPNLDGFVEVASMLILAIVSEEDDEDDDDDDDDAPFLDENTLPVQLLDWVEAAQYFQSAAIAMFEWEVGASDDDAWDLVSFGTAMLAVIADGKIENGVLHAPAAGVELVLKKLLETHDMVYEEEVSFRGLGVDDSGCLLFESASKFEKILAEAAKGKEGSAHETEQITR